MGRRVGYVLVFLGLFAIFFGALERVYAYPRLKKAPLDQYSQPVATGTGTYFNRSPDKLREVTGAQLRNIRTVRGDVKAGTDVALDGADVLELGAGDLPELVGTAVEVGAGADGHRLGVLVERGLLQARVGVQPLDGPEEDQEQAQEHQHVADPTTHRGLLRRQIGPYRLRTLHKPNAKT